jgi:AraC-like DNA-binding protein
VYMARMAASVLADAVLAVILRVQMARARRELRDRDLDG